MNLAALHHWHTKREEGCYRDLLSRRNNDDKRKRTKNLVRRMIASIVRYKRWSVLQETSPQLEAIQIGAKQAIENRDSGESEVGASRIRREKALTLVW